MNNDQLSNTLQHEPSLKISEVIALLADISEQVEDLFGKHGAHSVFRHAGRSLGRQLAQSHNGDQLRSREVVAEFFTSKGFAENVSLNGTEATIHNCNIGLELSRRKHACGHHPLCHFGFGLVDGVNREINNDKQSKATFIGSVVDDNGLSCKETW